MINNNYFKVKIPFVTKSYYSNRDDSMKMRGYAIYIFDKKLKLIVHEYIELIDTNFKCTNNEMKQKDYYLNNKKVREFRKLFLDQIKFSDKKDDYEIIPIDSNQKINIFSVNQYLKQTHTTIGILYSLFSGSNVSGAETNPKASPLITTEKGFQDCNFLNVLAKYESRKLKQDFDISQINMDYLIEYNINTLYNSNILPNFREYFKHYNPDYLNNDEVIDQLLNSELSSNKKRDYTNRLLDNLDIEEEITRYESITSKSSLRNLYNNNIDEKVKNHTITDNSMSIKKDHYSTIQRCHIISFSSCLKSSERKEQLKAVDGENVLFIDANTHILFDNNIITFNPKNGNIEFLNREEEKAFKDSYNIDNFLDMNSLSEKQKEYLKENYEYCKKYKKNKN